MNTLLGDCLLRLGKAEKLELKRIYQTEIQTKIWTEDERQLLTNAFDNRAIELNRQEIGLTSPRW